MVAALGDVEHGVEGSSLTAGGEHSGTAALKGADAGGHHVVSGVLQAGIEVAAGLQVEELAHVLAGVVFESGALYDRNLTRLAILRGVASLNTDCTEFLIQFIFLLV